MQKIKYIFILFSLLFLGACTQGSFQQVKYNPEYRTYETVKYLRFFQGSGVLVDEKVKVAIVAEITRKDIAAVYSLKKKMDKLGPEDLWSNALIKVYFSNVTKQNQYIILKAIKSSYKNILMSDTREVVLLPNSVERVVLNHQSIGTYDTSFRLFLEYNFEGRSKVKEIPMRRLKEDEYADFKKEKWF